MPDKLWKAGLVAQSLLYVAGGVNHFAMRRLYTGIMPTHYSHPATWVEFTGMAEILGGLGLLHPKTRKPAAWGLIALLLVYFDVHIFMLQHADRFAPIPKWALEARIPLQLVLITWAYVYTRRRARFLSNLQPSLGQHSLPQKKANHRNSWPKRLRIGHGHAPRR